MKRQLFAAMMRLTTHIMHNKSDDPNFRSLVARNVFVRSISHDKFSLRRMIRTTHVGDLPPYLLMLDCHPEAAFQLEDLISSDLELSEVL